MFVSPSSTSYAGTLAPSGIHFRGWSDLDEVRGMESPYGVSTLIGREERDEVSFHHVEI